MKQSKLELGICPICKVQPLLKEIFHSGARLVEHFSYDKDSKKWVELPDEIQLYDHDEKTIEYRCAECKEGFYRSEEYTTE